MSTKRKKVEENQCKNEIEDSCRRTLETIENLKKIVKSNRRNQRNTDSSKKLDHPGCKGFFISVASDKNNSAKKEFNFNIVSTPIKTDDFQKKSYKSTKQFNSKPPVNKRSFFDRVISGIAYLVIFWMIASTVYLFVAIAVRTCAFFMGADVSSWNLDLSPMIPY